MGAKLPDKLWVRSDQLACEHSAGEAAALHSKVASARLLSYAMP